MGPRRWLLPLRARLRASLTSERVDFEMLKPRGKGQAETDTSRARQSAKPSELPGPPGYPPHPSLCFTLPHVQKPDAYDRLHRQDPL